MSGDLKERLEDAGLQCSRSSIENGCAECGLHTTLIEDTKARIDQLEAALEEISALFAGGPHISAEAAVKTLGLKLIEARAIARAALATPTEGETP